jgi:proteasome lid subunit RPN8/RPN11
MKLNKETIEKIKQHALQEYPEECCGIVTADKSKQSVHLCKNIQNRLHKEDPAGYPRDARTAYMIERDEFDKVITTARGNGEAIIALYHSHPEHEAYFSEEDHAAQTVFGEPEFPDAVHVIISVINKKIQEIRCFKWNRETGTFAVLNDFI